jgi:hypothetical protein
VTSPNAPIPAGTLGADDVAQLPATRDGRIALAHVTIAKALFGDEQLDPVHGSVFDDPAVVVFRVLVETADASRDLAADLSEALVTAGFDRVTFEPPVPMPGSDGFRCDVAVPVGAP